MLALPDDLWLEILTRHGPLGLCRPRWCRTVAAQRLQRAWRRRRPFAVGDAVWVAHAAGWKTGRVATIDDASRVVVELRPGHRKFCDPLRRVLRHRGAVRKSCDVTSLKKHVNE